MRGQPTLACPSDRGVCILSRLLHRVNFKFVPADAASLRFSMVFTSRGVNIVIDDLGSFRSDATRFFSAGEWQSGTLTRMQEEGLQGDKATIATRSGQNFRYMTNIVYLPVKIVVDFENIIKIWMVFDKI